MLKRAIAFMRAQWIDFIQLYFAPGVAALLPWRLSVRWLKWWAAREHGPFDVASRAAAHFAPDYLPGIDAARFARRNRLVWLLDTADQYLSLTRWWPRWWPWHVEQVGAWPTTGTFIAVSFHHGTGHWVFRSLARAGRKSMIVSARWERSDFRGVPLRYWCGRMRYFDMERLGRCRVAMRPGVKDKIASTLAAGIPVIAVIDMPPRMAPRGQRRVRVLGQEISLPDGMFALAREAGVPVVPYWQEFDFERGTRRFCIGEPIHPRDLAQTTRDFAAMLDQRLRTTPEAWYFWPEMPQWIVDAAKLDAADEAAAERSA